MATGISRTRLFELAWFTLLELPADRVAAEINAELEQGNQRSRQFLFWVLRPVWGNAEPPYNDVMIRRQKVLAQLNSISAEVAKRLLDISRSGREEEQEWAIEFLAEFCKEAWVDPTQIDGVIQRLQDALSNKDDAIALAVAKALVGAKVKPDEVAAALKRLLQSDTPSIQIEAVKQLGSLGPRAEVAVPELAKLLQRVIETNASPIFHGIDARVEAIEIFESLGPVAKPALPVLKAIAERDIPIPVRVGTTTPGGGRGGFAGGRQVETVDLRDRAREAISKIESDADASSTSHEQPNTTTAAPRRVNHFETGESPLWNELGVVSAPVSRLTAKALEWIGLHLSPITKERFREKNVLAKYVGGLDVTFVRTHGPAEKAGIHEVDIVVGLQGRPTVSLRDLDLAMQDAVEQIQRKDADSLQFDVLRSGETVRVNVAFPASGLGLDAEQRPVAMVVVASGLQPVDSTKGRRRRRGPAATVAEREKEVSLDRLVKLAQDKVRQTRVRFEAGEASLLQLLDAMRGQAEARLQRAGDNLQDQLEALDDLVKIRQEILQGVRQMHDAGTLSESKLTDAEQALLEAQLRQKTVRTEAKCPQVSFHHVETQGRAFRPGAREILTRSHLTETDFRLEDVQRFHCLLAIRCSGVKIAQRAFIV